MKLTVVMVNSLRTQMALTHENSFLPHIKRTVQIELTPEQCALLKPRCVGVNYGKPVFEETGEVWLEPPPATSEISHESNT